MYRVETKHDGRQKQIWRKQEITEKAIHLSLAFKRKKKKNIISLKAYIHRMQMLAADSYYDSFFLFPIPKRNSINFSGRTIEITFKECTPETHIPPK
jgi:hypothetical protein